MSDTPTKPTITGGHPPPVLFPKNDPLKVDRNNLESVIHHLLGLPDKPFKPRRRKVPALRCSTTPAKELKNWRKK